jgi:DNA modification methylase
MLPMMDGEDRTKTASTFLDNLSLPIHRWFRYSAGFSAQWARELIEREKANGRRNVFDPFVGCGTVVLEAELCGANSIGIEAHPFITRVAKAKLLWREDAGAFYEAALSALKSAKQVRTICRAGTSPLLDKCYPPDVLGPLYALYLAIEQQDKPTSYYPLIWLTLAAILRDCSPVGTAQWQYVLPRKSKTRSIDPYEAFAAMALVIRQDMLWRQAQEHGAKPTLYQEDARRCSSVADGWADLVITSPPYANNYDYADATRLEMTFFGEIKGWGCLQDAVRKHLIRSCTQHVASERQETARLLEQGVLAPIRRELVEVCEKLETEKENHGGKKPYHAMVAAYFHDLAQVWIALRRVTANGGLACFVIGDSAPYGVYVPVDRWLGELALAAGFKCFEFEKTRDRNVKWKNRKHRVPLHEGRLWVKG